MSQVLNALCRGIVGHVSFLATCRASTIYSEYLLYEPILRIALSRGFQVECEVDAGIPKKGRGDKKRLDFVIKNVHEHLALEVKWTRVPSTDFSGDMNKLKSYCKPEQETQAQDSGSSIGTCKRRGYLLVFGETKILEKLCFREKQKPINAGKLVHWANGRTNNAAQWFRYV